jgi:hypothetical protein
MIPTYPLTSAQVAQITEHNETDNQELTTKLSELSKACKETCNTQFNKCNLHQKEMRKLYRTFYTNILPERWTSYRPEDYITDIQKLFEAQASMKRIRTRKDEERFKHLRDERTMYRVNDHPEVKKAKDEARAMFDMKSPLDDIDVFLLQRQAEIVATLSDEEKAKQDLFDACRTEEEKYLFYRNQACLPLENDSPGDAELRAKWAKLFDAGIPYEDIYHTMEKDINDRLAKIRGLEEKLADVKMGEMAHNKLQAAKQKERQRKAEKAARLEEQASKDYGCVTQGCQNPAKSEDGRHFPFECEKCESLFQLGKIERPSYFCSKECAVENGRAHNLKFHYHKEDEVEEGEA